MEGVRYRIKSRMRRENEWVVWTRIVSVRAGGNLQFNSYSPRWLEGERMRVNMILLSVMNNTNYNGISKLISFAMHCRYIPLYSGNYIYLCKTPQNSLVTKLLRYGFIVLQLSNKTIPNKTERKLHWENLIIRINKIVNLTLQLIW